MDAKKRARSAIDMELYLSNYVARADSLLRDGTQ
jgi:hypothetical protein